MKVATQTVSNVHHFRPIEATYTAPVQETLDVSNAVAAELAGISTGCSTRSRSASAPACACAGTS